MSNYQGIYLRTCTGLDRYDSFVDAQDDETPAPGVILKLSEVWFGWDSCQMASMVQQIWMKLFALLNIWPTHDEHLCRNDHIIITWHHCDRISAQRLRTSDSLLDMLSHNIMKPYGFSSFLFPTGVLQISPIGPSKWPRRPMEYLWETLQSISITAWKVSPSPVQIFMKGHEPFCSEDPLKFRCRTDEKSPGEIKCGGKFKHLQTFCYSNYILYLLGCWSLVRRNSPRPSRFSPENDVPKYGSFHQAWNFSTTQPWES